MSGAILNHSCPHCGDVMRPRVYGCPSCELEVRGRFRQTLFDRLSSEELATLEEYLLSGFSLKALGERTGHGYVALRTKIDRLIERYRTLREGEEEIQEVLDRIERGELAAVEGAKRIQEIRGTG